MANYIGTLRDANSNTLYPASPDWINISSQVTWGSALTNFVKNVTAYYDPQTRRVHGALSVYPNGTDLISATSDIATMPSGYRPTSTVYIQMMLYSGNIWYPYPGFIASGGYIRQQLGNSVSRIYCVFDYQC